MLSQWESGDVEGARVTLRKLNEVAPSLSVDSYVRMGNSASPGRQRVIAVLRAMGTPEI